jgi:hypothetical protein
MSWDQRFYDPIKLPGRRKPLVTLRDAAQYIIKLTKAERDLPQWETAIEVLMLIGERGGDPMMANIAMMQALHRDEPKSAPEPRQGLVCTENSNSDVVMVKPAEDRV